MTRTFGRLPLRATNASSLACAADSRSRRTKRGARLGAGASTSPMMGSTVGSGATNRPRVRLPDSCSLTASPPFGGSVPCGPELPVAGHALQRVRAPIVELQLGPDHEILDRAGDEDLAGPRDRAHARADVHADAGDVVLPPLDLTGVQ